MPYKKKEKVSLLLYYDYLEQFECLTDGQLRKLIYAMIEYDKNEKEIQLDKVTKMAFIPIKKRLKLDKENWISTCKVNSKNAKIRWDKENATVCDGMRKDAKYAEIEKEIEKEKEIERESVCIKNTHYTAPTLTEIISYGTEIGASVQYCEKFFDNYESTGWVDKNNVPIKSWKAKLRYWFNDDVKKGNTKNESKKEIDTRKVYDDEDGRIYQLNSDGTKHYIN